MHSYSVAAHTSADAEVVYSALVRAATWTEWSPIDAVQIDAVQINAVQSDAVQINAVQINGEVDPAERQDVGATRIFRTGRNVSRERIVELVADRRFGYENLGGPFRSYRGTIDLAENPQGGTDITWAATFQPKLPGSGRFWRWYLTRYMQRMADGLAAWAVAADRSQP